MLTSEQFDQVIQGIVTSMEGMSPSKRVMYLQRRLAPLFRLQEELCSHRYDAYATEADSEDFRVGYEGGVRSCEGELTQALQKMASDTVDTRFPPKSDPDEPF